MGWEGGAGRGSADEHRERPRPSDVARGDVLGVGGVCVWGLGRVGVWGLGLTVRCTLDTRRSVGRLSTNHTKSKS